MSNKHNLGPIPNDFDIDWDKIDWDGTMFHEYQTSLIEGIPLDPNDSMYTQLVALITNGDTINE